jgi:hypothetical protein
MPPQQQGFDLSNPYRTALLKYAQQLLGDRYSKYHEIMLRLTAHIVTERDATDFGQMLVDLYENGFKKAVEDYRKAVEAQGFKVEVRRQEPA